MNLFVLIKTFFVVPVVKYPSFMAIYLLSIGLIWAKHDKIVPKIDSTHAKVAVRDEKSHLNYLKNTSKSPEFSCPAYSETLYQCFRNSPEIYLMESGLPGTQSRVFSSKLFEEISINSFSNPTSMYSQYGGGGLSYRSPLDLNFDLYLNQSSVYSDSLNFNSTVLDTPLTNIYWERGALDMNVFRVSFNRLIGSKLLLSFHMGAQKLTGQDFIYSPQVHQPFIGLLDRDSTSMVIEGISPNVDASQISPVISYSINQNHKLILYFDGFLNKSDRASLKDSITLGLDRGYYDEQIQVNVPSSYNGKTAGLTYSHFSGPFHFNTSYYHHFFTRRDVYKLSSFQIDSMQTLVGDVDKITLTTGIKKWNINPKLFLNIVSNNITGPLSFLKRSEAPFSENVDLISPGTYLDLPKTDGWSDFETLQIKTASSFGRYFLELKGGLKRKSTMVNEKEIRPFWGINNNLILPWGITLAGAYNRIIRSERWDNKYLFNEVFLKSPNPYLKSELIDLFEGSFLYHSAHANIGIKFNQVNIENSVLPLILPQQDTLQWSINDASTLINYPSEHRSVFAFDLTLKLGNWRASVSPAILFNSQIKGLQDTISNPVVKNFKVPSNILKGFINWQNSFVKNRLRVNTRVNWEWFSERYGYVPISNRKVSSRKLDSFLILDFMALMQIRSFELFTQIKNMNHDRYYLQMGEHPPGINIRWGINWTLKN